MQLTQLYTNLELIYLEMLTLTQGLQTLCANNSFLTEDERGKLAELLFRREKLMEQASACQEEVRILEKKLQVSLNPVQGKVLLRPEKDSPSLPEKFSATPHRLDALVKEIIALDAVTSQSLRHSLQRAAREIKKIQVTKKANKAYRDQDFQAEGFFIDSDK